MAEPKKDRYPGLTDELLLALHTTDDALPGEHAVYERVVKWINIDGTTIVAQSNTPNLDI